MQTPIPGKRKVQRVIGRMLSVCLPGVLLLASSLSMISCLSNNILETGMYADGQVLLPGIPSVVTLGTEDTSQNLVMRISGNKTLIPVQHVTGNLWVFMASDTVRLPVRYEILKSPAAAGQVRVTLNDQAIEVSVRQKPVLTYQAGTRFPPEGLPAFYQRSGFIHPAYTPEGQVLTDAFPAGHAHQHGIFSAWVNTEFEGRDTDFWNQQDLTGTVLFDSLVRMQDGPVYAELVTRQIHVALQGIDTVPVLKESWKIRVYNNPDMYIWDIVIMQENIAGSVLDILPYHYGGMAFRGSHEWNDTTLAEDVEFSGPGSGGFLTNSEAHRLDGNHTRPRWTAMFGKVGGRSASLAVIQHNDNPGYPQFVRIHPRMPYFCYLPFVQAGMKLRPGDTYSSAYRVVMAASPPDTALLNAVTARFIDFPVSQ